jgi:hypothetical protein
VGSTGSLERLEATFEPYDGKSLVPGSHDEVGEGAWPGYIVLLEFPTGTPRTPGIALRPTRSPATWGRTVPSPDIILVDQVDPDLTSADFGGRRER